MSGQVIIADISTLLGEHDWKLSQQEKKMEFVYISCAKLD